MNNTFSVTSGSSTFDYSVDPNPTNREEYIIFDSDGEDTGYRVDPSPFTNTAALEYMMANAVIMAANLMRDVSRAYDKGFAVGKQCGAREVEDKIRYVCQLAFPLTQDAR